MTHYIIEIALWILLAYVIGCVLGYLLHRLFGTADATAPGLTADARMTPEAVQPVQPGMPKLAELDEAEPVAPSAVGPEPVPGAPRRMERPKGLSEARHGKPDKLQRISGIGPKNEKILHTLGFYHFDQIASWTVTQVAWVDDHLKFNGRIGREQWIEQANLLANGEEEKFETRFGSKRPPKQG